MLSWVLAISLFSLAGIPPTAGFFGKFFLLMAGAGQGNYLFITIAALNMVVSLYYYLKVVKAIFMDSNENPIKKLMVPASPKLALFICSTGIILTGVMSYVYEYIFFDEYRILNLFMAINQNHLSEELNGIKCAIVEKNVTPERAAFLQQLLMFNKYKVEIAESASSKNCTAQILFQKAENLAPLTVADT